MLSISATFLLSLTTSLPLSGSRVDSAVVPGRHGLKRVCTRAIGLPVLTVPFLDFAEDCSFTHFKYVESCSSFKDSDIRCVNRSYSAFDTIESYSCSTLGRRVSMILTTSSSLMTSLSFSKEPNISSSVRDCFSCFGFEGFLGLDRGATRSRTMMTSEGFPRVVMGSDAASSRNSLCLPRGRPWG